MLITYEAFDEVIVCTTETEKKMRKEYFPQVEGVYTDRDLDVYDREERPQGIFDVSATLKVRS